MATALEQQLGHLSLTDAGGQHATHPAQAHNEAPPSGGISVPMGSGADVAPSTSNIKQHVVAGGGAALQALRELIGWPQLYAAQAAQLGVRWPRGLLLHGPPGCGKTLMVQAVAEEFGAVLHTVTAADVYGAYVGQSERRLREAFEAAAQDVARGRTAVVFLDEVDALCPRRDAHRAHESRVVAQLLTLIDGTGSVGGGGGGLHGANPAQQLPAGAITVTVGGQQYSIIKRTDPACTDTSTTDTAAPASTAEEADVRTSSNTIRPGSGTALVHAGMGPAAGGSFKQGHLVVVGATNRPGALDPALRRPGRLDREVSVSVPDASQRAALLAAHTAGLQLHPELDLASLAASCHGYSGADLAALAREAVLVALSDAAAPLLTHRKQLQPPVPGQPLEGAVQEHAVANEQFHDSQALAGHQGADATTPVVVVTPAHIAAAMRRVGPSIVRGAEVEVPQASWDDIGGLDDVKRRLRQSVEWPLKHREAFSRLGLTPPRGVLLYGPPGCSKTSLARAAASASGATLIPLSCAQLFSMYVGEGEAVLRDMFRRARLAAPSLLLLDEIDAVAARRGEGGEGGHAGGESGLRLLTSLLTEMDGAEDNAAGVLVLATTNRPEAVDGALLRPGRFDTLLYVPPPDQQGRLQVLQVHTRGMPLAEDVDLPALAAATHNYTGAELAGLCREAALAALREDFQGATHVAQRHFEAARAASRAPSLSPLTLAAFENWAAGRKARARTAAAGVSL